MSNRTSALERLLSPSVGDLPPDYARRLLELKFSSAEQARYLELSEKVQAGSLSPEEEDELDDLLIANDVLMILRAKAESSLNASSAA